MVPEVWWADLILPCIFVYDASVPNISILQSPKSSEDNFFSGGFFEFGTDTKSGNLSLENPENAWAGFFAAFQRKREPFARSWKRRVFPS